MTTVVEALCEVSAALAESGIGKGQQNTYDNYAFRGIDDVYNAMGPLLAKHKLVIAPVKVASEIRQTQTSGGKASNHCKVTVNYSIVCPGGDQPLVVEAQGEAMDRGDKSLNKAMSSAYKNLVFQLFCIPVQGQDSEQESHEIEPLAQEIVDKLNELYRSLDESRRATFDDWYKGKFGLVLFEALTESQAEHVNTALTRAYGQQYAEEQALTNQSMGNGQ